MNLQRTQIGVIPAKAGTQTGQIRGTRSLARIKKLQGLGSRPKVYPREGGDGNDKPRIGIAV
jgi:hypothetical protein